MVQRLRQRRLIGAGLVLGLALVASGAPGAEREISFRVSGQAVRGTLETPRGAAAPVVLLLHGFTGSRDELPVAGTEEGILARTARILAGQGYASLRIDFRGSGESDGAWADTTLAGQIRDAVAAIDWLAGQQAVRGRETAVLGWSQGGLVAAHAAAERPTVRALVLWAPVVHPLHSYASLLGDATFLEAMHLDPGAELTATLPWGDQTTLKAAFFQELALYNSAAAVARYAGPMQVLVGARDDVIQPQPATSEALLRYHEGVETLSVFDTDHVWSAFEGPAVLDEQLLPATVEWLDRHLAAPPPALR